MFILSPHLKQHNNRDHLQEIVLTWLVLISAFIFTFSGLAGNIWRIYEKSRPRLRTFS